MSQNGKKESENTLDELQVGVVIIGVVELWDGFFGLSSTVCIGKKCIERAKERYVAYRVFELREIIEYKNG